MMNYQDLSIEDIYKAIGEELTSTQALPLSRYQLIERGKRWFDANLQNLLSQVCGNQIVKQLINGSDMIALVTVIADLIASTVVGVSPITAASLIVKIGVKKLCSEKNNNNFVR